MGAVLGALLELFGVRLRGVLGGFLDLPRCFPDALARGLRGLLRHLLTVLERLLSRLLRLLLHLVGDRTEPLVLDPRGRYEHAREEACRGGSDREPERVLLRDPDRLATRVPDLASVGCRFRHLAADAGQLRRDALHLLLDRLTRPRRDVGLVAKGVDGLSHPLAGGLYLLPDGSWVFAHCTSSFTV